jgi:ATP-dependent Clp protease, protease subunit
MLPANIRFDDDDDDDDDDDKKKKKAEKGEGADKSSAI